MESPVDVTNDRKCSLSLDDFGYIAMSGTFSIRRSSQTSSYYMGDFSLTTPMTSPAQDVQWTNTQEAKISAGSKTRLLPLPPLPINAVSSDSSADESCYDDDTYVTMSCSSLTYLSPKCVKSCYSRTEKKEEADCTYMSIEPVETSEGIPPVDTSEGIPPVDTSEGIPPSLPNRKKHSTSRKRSRKPGAGCRTAKVQKLSPLRPKHSDIVTSKYNRKYSVQEILESVSNLTRDLESDVTLNSGETSDHCEHRNGGNRSYTLQELDAIMFNKTSCELPHTHYYNRQTILRCKSQKPWTSKCSYGSAPYSQTEFKRHSRDVTTDSQMSQTTIYADRDRVQLPVKSRQKARRAPSRRMSFVERLGSVKSLVTSSKSRCRHKAKLFSSSDHWLPGDTGGNMQVGGSEGVTGLDFNNNKCLYGSHVTFAASGHLKSKETIC